MENILEIKNLNYKYPYDDTYVLYKLDFTLKCGEYKTLELGKKGGRSTLAKIIGGVITDYQGNVFYNGKESREYELSQRKIAVIYDNFVFKRTSVKKNIEYIVKLREKDKITINNIVNEVIDRYKINTIAYKQAMKLSDIEKIMVTLARIDTRQIDLLVVDDIFDRFNENQVAEVRKWISFIADRQKCAVLILK